MIDKRIQAGNEGEELVPGVTENLSSSLHSEGDAARPDDRVGREGEGAEKRDQFDRREDELPGRQA